ncbi:hypothetical protein [Streptomyces griseocarneus]|uniref:hypothetical protein n=1 Tax=Streptomyces griseocarneus TaxID=51201 RepID=UPI00199D53AF|nr:hypothetical protein [Streptomyces griseocarneus]MBZ6473991.1 hypothetical protein [Streptomyces griseocarneus]GHG66241.1 hypothetical protein GCM10018779_37650 [Streptomyces griseocarneus]
MRLPVRAEGPLTGLPLLTACLLRASLLTVCLLTGCAAPASPPADPDEVIKAATGRLTDACLARQGLTPQRPGQSPVPAAEQRRLTAALFGAGPAELSVALPTGYVVRAHTDGCLAAAQQRLYGDQRRWFHASVIVNNLRPEAAHTHSGLAEVRARHHAELDDWRELRAHALAEATTLLADPPPTGDPRP